LAVRLFRLSKLYGAAEDQVHRPVSGPTTLDRLLNTSQRMGCQQLQDTNEPSWTCMLAMLFLQVIAEFFEHGRQLPFLEDCRVVQIGGLAAQHDEIMSWIKEMFARGITPLVSSNHLMRDHDFDVVYVGFYCRRVKGELAWHAVAIFVEGDCLVLVDLAWIADTIIEAVAG